MKKIVVLCLAGFLILAFGATGFAQDKLEFRASGSFDVQTHWSQNVPPLNANATPIYNSLPADYNTFVPANGGASPTNALNKNVAYWDSRFSLRFDAVMSKELSGTLQFEIDSTRWGNSLGGQRPGSEAHAVGAWSTDKVAVEVKYMYMDFGLPYFGIPVPMTVRAGIQPLAVRPAFFAATDGAGVSAAIKIDPVTINPLYFKPAEGADWVSNDDVDVYGLQVNARVSTFTIGGYGFLYHMGNNYAMGQQGFTNPPVGPINPYTPGTQHAQFYWLGAYADGKAGPVDINFDFGADWGTVKSRNSGGNSAPNVKYAGWASRLKVDFPWEKFNFGVIGMYATGSDANRTSQSGLAGSTAADGTPSTRVSGWMVPAGSEAGAVNSESAVFYGMEAGASGGQGWAVNHNYAQSSKGPFGGSWFAKAYTSAKVTPWYKVTLQGLYIGDTGSNGNTYGTARRYVGASGSAAGLLRNDDFIGVELDLLNEFQIYKNLTFKVFGGYLWAGNALDLYSGSTTTGNFAIHNPWALRTRLIYTF